MCGEQVESVLREQIANNELKLKAYKNSSSLVQAYNDKNLENCKVCIGYENDTLKNRKIKIDCKKKVVNDGVPEVHKNAKISIFKIFILEFDEEMLVTKQQLCDEDEALNYTQYISNKVENVSGKTNTTEKVEKRNLSNLRPLLILKRKGIT